MNYKGSQAVGFAPQRSGVVKRLIAAGVIPGECVRFELVFDVTEPIRATCTFNVTEDQLEAIAKAYEEHPEEAAGIVRDIVRPAAEVRIPEFDHRNADDSD